MKSGLVGSKVKQAEEAPNPRLPLAVDTTPVVTTSSRWLVAFTTRMVAELEPATPLVGWLSHEASATHASSAMMDACGNDMKPPLLESQRERQRLRQPVAIDVRNLVP